MGNPDVWFLINGEWIVKLLSTEYDLYPDDIFQKAHEKFLKLRREQYQRVKDREDVNHHDEYWHPVVSEMKIVFNQK
jgi:hypothetical protein